MFAGVGGFRAGLTRVGGFQCVGHCEIDKYAEASYRAIHDIREEERYYAIGKADPVAVDIDTHGSGEYGDDVLAQAVRQVFELTPAGMIRTLGLDKPIFAQFCNYGHFTHQDAPWEQCDCADLLWNVCRVKEAGVSSR